MSTGPPSRLLPRVILHNEPRLRTWRLPHSLPGRSRAQLEATANELAYLDAQIQAQQAQAQLEEAIQRPVKTWPALEQGRSAQTKKVKP